MKLALRDLQEETRRDTVAYPQTASESSVTLLSASVARISDDDLRNMSREDLIDVARIATPSLPQQEFHSHLPYMSREQLRQLVCLARHSCRLQTDFGHDCT